MIIVAPVNSYIFFIFLVFLIQLVVRLTLRIMSDDADLSMYSVNLTNGDGKKLRVLSYYLIILLKCCS